MIRGRGIQGGEMKQTSFDEELKRILLTRDFPSCSPANITMNTLQDYQIKWIKQLITEWLPEGKQENTPVPWTE